MQCARSIRQRQFSISTLPGMLRIPMRYLEIPLDVLRKAAARLSRAASMIRGASP
jgi:hypothetical protein